VIQRENVEVKVGIFVFIGMLILFVIVFSIGDFYLWNPGYSVRASFRFINGVEESAPVRFAGVNAGEVKKTQIVVDPATGQTSVELLLWVRQHVMIPEDSVVTINTLGLLGEKYVEIIPGSSNAKPLKDGDKIRGKDPLATEAIAEKAYAVAAKLDQTMTHINEVVQDSEFKNSLKQVVVNTVDATDSAKAILFQIQSGQGTLGKLVYEESVHKNLEDLTGDLKENPWKLLQKPKEKKK
jgi:phospholipid/cholesterol/gamma-HCH transport system substrate-binding protein